MTVPVITGRWRRGGWWALATCALVFGVGALISGVAALSFHHYYLAAHLPVALLFWYWIGVGAVRRATRVLLTTVLPDGSVESGWASPRP
jgi:hypothetical protein